jgi:hypothetical protein
MPLTLCLVEVLLLERFAGRRHGGGWQSAAAQASHLLHVRGANQSWPPLKPPQSNALLVVEDEMLLRMRAVNTVPLTLLARADEVIE